MNMTDKILRLDIACGKNKKPGFTGVDIWTGADIVADLEIFPWPFDDDSVDEVFCSHYLEHTPDLISFANELYRIMKVGAKAEIICPYYSSIRAWQDPTHLRAISENTFLYFKKEWRVGNRLDHYPITADFDFECSYVLDSEWQGKNEEELRFAIKHYINVVSDIRAVLMKRKFIDDDLELLLRQASEFWESGMFDDAMKKCLDVVSRDAANAETYLMLAEYSLKTGNAVSAVDYFRKAVEEDSESLQAHVGIVRSLSMMGRIDDLEAHLTDVRKFDPDLADLIEGIVSSN
jgi:tetratricopeptide (TPR) repeat protein